MGFFGLFRKQELKPRGPLVPYKSEFKSTCQDWLNGLLSSAEAHDIFVRLHSEVYQLACVDGKIPTQAGYDFVALSKEMCKATEFESLDRSIAFDAIALVEYHLGDLQGSNQWYSLLERCCGFERMVLNCCQVCGFSWPSVFHNPFANTPIAVCISCGDLFGTNAWDERLYGILLTKPGAERDQLVETAGILLKQCPCGGDLGFSHGKDCPKCGDDLVECSPMSPYQYLQTHKVLHLEKYITRRVSIRTEAIQTDAVTARNKILEALGELLVILQQTGAADEAAKVEEIANALCEDLSEGLSTLFKYYAAGFTSFVIKPAEGSLLESHDLLNLNIKLRALRTKVHQEAIGLKYLLKHLQQ